MEDLTVTLFLVESTGILTELDRVKMSGRGGGRQGGIAWSGNSLAIITGRIYYSIFHYCAKFKTNFQAIFSSAFGTSKEATITY